jgi:hypothetical protein
MKDEAMSGTSYKMNKYRAAFYLLLAAFIAFLPADLLQPLSNAAPAGPFHSVPMLAVALPPGPAVVAASRAQQMSISAVVRQNSHHAITASFYRQPGIGVRRCGSRFEHAPRALLHKSRHNCDRAPPWSDSR